MDALALVAWFIALRWLVRRPPPWHFARAGATNRPSRRNALP